MINWLVSKQNHTTGFSLNGELLMDAMGGETAFTDVQGDAFVPAGLKTLKKSARYFLCLQ